MALMEEIIKKIEQKQKNKKIPEIRPGFTIEVVTIIREGNKQRKQKFKGLVLSVSGKGVNKMITVRKISYGVGVEKIFPIYSTNIDSIKVIKFEPVRRSKLYFMRKRVGKMATRIKKGRTVFVPEEGVLIQEEILETKASEKE